jgi:hypothetical protein
VARVLAPPQGLKSAAAGHRQAAAVGHGLAPPEAQQQPGHCDWARRRQAGVRRSWGGRRAAGPADWPGSAGAPVCPHSSFCSGCQSCVGGRPGRTAVQVRGEAVAVPLLPLPLPPPLLLSVIEHAHACQYAHVL